MVGALAFSCSIRLHATARCSYCAWSGDVEMMAIFTLLGLVYTTRCCWGWSADRVVRRGSSCLIGSTRGRFALSIVAISALLFPMGPTENDFYGSK